MRFTGAVKPAMATNPLTGEKFPIWRQAHQSGGPTKFNKCVASRARGHGGDIRSRTSNFGASAKACAGTRGH